ncbi:Uncharacterised protein [Vibrio cholerae]|nr:Uncharacterised protein [Vibrio cholerae]CSD47206.1 Uncharacterised protein [Vibrio cholerae]
MGGGKKASIIFPSRFLVAVARPKAKYAMCILHHQMWVELFARLSYMDKAKALS